MQQEPNVTIMYVLHGRRLDSARDIELEALSGCVGPRRAARRRCYHLLSSFPPPLPTGTQGGHHLGQVFGDQLNLEGVHQRAAELQRRFFLLACRVGLWRVCALSRPLYARAWDPSGDVWVSGCVLGEERTARASPVPSAVVEVARFASDGRLLSCSMRVLRCGSVCQSRYYYILCMK